MSKTHAVVSGAQVVETLRASIEEAMGELQLSAEPAELYDPARYILESGGKRLRPLLLLLTAQAFEVPVRVAMPGALAVEVFHNFTLVHDDIMDHADTRRGRQTVHKKWDEATAILSGDYLMAFSYELLSTLPARHLPEVLEAYHRMVRMLCEGQAMDKAFETRKDVSLNEYFGMIERKTGALIQAAFEIGGILGEASASEAEQLILLGKHMGRAFQIQDDLLDLVAENQKWGKKVGGDLIEGKKAYLLLKAIELTSGEQKNFFRSIIDKNGLPEEQIPLARMYMEECGVIEDARQAVLDHSERAIQCLHHLPEGESTNALKWLILKMQSRIH